VEIILTERFEQAYDKLNDTEKRSVRKAITLLGDNLRHPGLHVKKMEGRQNIWDARPSKRLGLTFEMDGEAVIIRNVGEHDKVLKSP